MGHSTLGDQPQSPLSTLSLKAYLKCCRITIEQFMLHQQLGWKRPDFRPFHNQRPIPDIDYGKYFQQTLTAPQPAQRQASSQLKAWLQAIDISHKSEASYRRIFTALNEIAHDNAFATWLLSPTSAPPPKKDEIESLDIDLIGRLVDLHLQERLNTMELRRALTLRYRLYHQAVGAPKTMLIPLFSPMRISPFTFDRGLWATQYLHYRTKLRAMLRKKHSDQSDLALLGLHAVLNGRILNKHAFSALIALTNPAVKLNKMVTKCGKNCVILGITFPLSEAPSLKERTWMRPPTACCAVSESRRL